MSTRTEWIERARGEPISTILRQRGIKLRKQAHELVGACPVCKEGVDRFAVDLRRQLFNCRKCGRGGGDAIALVRFLDRCDFLVAVERIAGPPPEDKQTVEAPVARAPADQADVERRLRNAERIWNEAGPIAGTAGATYLAGRGIALDDVPDHGGLRWHPRCIWENGTAPCVVSRFTDAITGEPRGIHRRPITGAKPMTLGPIGGAVIRLWPDAEVTTGLVVGEGIETTLAAATRMTHRGVTLRPAWAAGCALNVKRFPVLPGVDCLTLLVDADESGTGQSAAAECAARWREAGCEVIRLIPNKLGTDFNDLVRPCAT
jgi:phage/plasmid primase-like uncharacterized protein